MGNEAETGCSACFRGEAEQVWANRPFAHVSELMDDSHFGVNILRCKACGQMAVKVFTEFVDWGAGDDAQYWTIIPLEMQEAVALTGQVNDVDTKLIEKFSTGRRCLQVDHPTGKPRSIRWSVGPIWIVEGH
jgi:hypothetical protein